VRDDDETVVRERLLHVQSGWAMGGSLVGSGPAFRPDGHGSLLGGADEPRPASAAQPRSASGAWPWLGSADEPRSTGRAESRVQPLIDAPPEVDDLAAGARLPARRLLGGPGAFDPGRRGVRALAAVAVLVVLAAGAWAWRSRPETQPVAADSSSAPAMSTEAAAASPSGATGEVVVAVAGKVRRPGLVRLSAGARVADAIAGAGGVLPGTDIALLNLARKVVDGELLLIGVTAPPGVAGQPGAAAPAAGDAAPGGKVNLNTATLAQLDTLPGVGPVLAQRILDHRERHGGFRSVGDLRQVEGFGDARYEQLKELVSV
jgi:competence protein ComEA